MRHTTIYSALVAVLVTGGTALAQNGVGGLSTNGLQVNQSGTAGFTNSVPVTDAFGNTFFTNGFSFTPGFSTGFVPAFGFGGYGPAFSGPLVDVRSAWSSLSPSGIARGGGFSGLGVPTVGINVPPGAIRLPPSRVYVKLTQDPNPATRVAGSRQETRRDSDSEPIGEVRGGETSPTQVRLASRLHEVMEDRPLREGRVVSIGATAAQVRYEADGEVLTSRFPVEEVFFFQRNGSIASAATDPNLIRVGSQVLIPQPLIRREPRQSITGGATITPEFKSSVRSSVAGSRQETSSKSKATKRKTNTTRKTR